MRITGIKLYTVKSGDTGARGAAMGESQYWGGGWQAQTLISNPMSVHPKYARIRSLWMGGGQDPFVIEIFTDEGASGFCANYGGGAFACATMNDASDATSCSRSPLYPVTASRISAAASAIACRFASSSVELFAAISMTNSS